MGVGFRYTIKKIADDLKISGTIKNIDFDCVHATFKTDIITIKKIIHLACQKNEFIKIDEVFYKQVELKESNNFTIIY